VSLSKKQRKEVWDKSGGHCWYCGQNLPQKGWHADHVEPILRESKYVRENSKGVPFYKVVQTGTSLRPQHDCIENIVPSCAPCNLFKAAFNVEFFRQEIAAQIERVRKSSSGFRIAERMGIIEPQESKPVVFWFESRNSISQ
jgi:hypothetical protein